MNDSILFQPVKFFLHLVRIELVFHPCFRSFVGNLCGSVWLGFLKDSFTWFPVLMQEVFEGNTPFNCHYFPYSHVHLAGKYLDCFSKSLARRVGSRTSPSLWNCYFREGLVKLTIQASLGTIKPMSKACHRLRTV